MIRAREKLLTSRRRIFTEWIQFREQLEDTQAVRFDASKSPHQVLESSKLARLKRDGSSCARHHAGEQIELRVADATWGDGGA